MFDSTRLKRNIKNRWFGYVAGNDPNSRVTEMIPDFGIGCHLDGVEPGSAPASNVYWFEGVLVVLVAELGRDGDLILFENGLSKVLETAQRERRSYFNAVLLSIEDVILIRVSSNGYVELTEAYNLMNYDAVNSRDPVPFHVCNLCYVREGQFSNDEQETSQWVQTRFPPATEGEQKRQTRNYTNSLSNEPLAENPPRSPSAAFMSLVHLFKAAALELLKPSSGPNEGVFPAEVYHKILDSVDEDTYAQCLTVSQNFRRYCQEYFRFIPGFVITNYEMPRGKVERPYHVDVSDQLPGVLKITDQSTGVAFETKFHICGADYRIAEGYDGYLKKWPKCQDGTQWRVVIGRSPCSSILDSVSFMLQDVHADPYRTWGEPTGNRYLLVEETVRAREDFKR